MKSNQKYKLFRCSYKKKSCSFNDTHRIKSVDCKIVAIFVLIGKRKPPRKQWTVNI